VVRLKHCNPPVGLLADMKFQSATLDLQPGDRIILVTDGVTEAENSVEDFYGEDRLEKAAGCDDPFENIFSSLQQFCGDTPFNDDCTVVEIKYLAAGQPADQATVAAAANS
jgi:serine phosphatase RsbU (regulator of sigma subunit)